MFKRILFIAMGALCLFTVTGCGNNSDTGKLSCTKTSTDEDGYEVTDTMNVSYEKNKVTTVENINISEMDANYIDMTISFGNTFASALNEINGFNATYSKEDDTHVKYVVTVDYTKLDTEALKNVFGDNFDAESFYSSKDITIDEFKEQNLKDYTCK